MARKEADLRWEEVRSINCYALFMGYLLMAVRGLGCLVITWSTVVLLGGFVSMLEKKDFWSLTVITLVLIPRASDVGLKDKLRHIGESFYGLSLAIIATLIPEHTKNSLPRTLLAGVVWLCHMLVGPIVVCPLAALYLCGPLFSAGISVWRLIERGYSNDRKEEDTHLQPALVVLYSLALLQGLLFGYRFCTYFARKRLVNDVVEAYNMKIGEDNELVKEYLRGIVNGCEKDPAFFKERNLATYAVEMIKSESSESFLSGARILDALLKHALKEVKAEATLKEQHQQQALTAELIGLASSTHVLDKLLQALDSISPHDEMRKMRELAANIMVHLAGRTRVMQFPQVIQRIGSLLDVSQQQYEESAAYRKLLMEKGLVILYKLASTADDDNCRAIAIINAQGLLSKVLAPLSFDLIHLVDHESWATIVVASLQVMCRLVAAPGETGVQLRSQISSNKEVIHGMERILKCCGCGDKLHILSIEIITQLPMDVVNMESRGNYIKMLASIFTDATKAFSIRQLGGEALVKLSQSESDAAIILMANDYVVHDLSNILLLDVVDNNTNRIIAAKILKHLYIYYKKNDDYLNILKKTLEDVLPKVLQDTLSGLKGKETQLAENGMDKHGFLWQRTTDVEAQEVGVPRDDGSNNNASTRQQSDAKKFLAALLSLIAAIFDKLIIQDHDLAQLVDKISPGDSATSFAYKLMDVVRANSEPTASCLSIMKNTSKMIISMMKHNDSRLNEDFLKIFIQSMSNGCKAMSCLEGSMILDSTNLGTVKPHMTLTSLVKEAQELLVTKEPKER